MNPHVDRLIEKARADDSVLAVLLFGSRARGEETSRSDVDLCLVLPSGKDTPEDRMTARLAYMPSIGVDIHVFQLLPLYIRSRVLREGVVLYCRDMDELYTIAYRTAEAYEDFKPRYRYYLEQVADAGP